jgi:alkylation response protein AidB-like acyl-CoA dehydrogenase
MHPVALQEVPGLPRLPRPLPPGIPTEERYIARYCAARGAPSPLAPGGDWPFYLALSAFRLASILAGVGARAAQGNASSAGAAQMGAGGVVRALASTGLRLLQGRVAAESGAAAAAEADRALPPAAGGNSSIGGGGGSGGGTQPAPTAAAAAAFEAAALAAQRSQPGLGPSARVRPLAAALAAFMEGQVYPAEAALNAHAASAARWSVHPLQEALKAAARAAGLWNLWVPADLAARLRPMVEAAEGSPAAAAALLGPGLTNLEYAHCAEVMGRSAWAPECFNCSAPDTGNMEVLARYGDARQQAAWLLPLLRGEIRSCFAMTEPAVASSDATNIRGAIARDPGGGTGSDSQGYVVNAHKWWASGACDPRCAVAIVMGRAASTPGGPSPPPRDEPHGRQSMVLVPMDAPGVTVVRPLPVFGYDDAPHGHAELRFEGVRVPRGSMILGEGRGFEIAQGRLGPGRLHHCMRLVGMGERALELMAARAAARVAFGRPLVGHQSVRLDLARSRVELDAARLTVLEAARALDAGGAKAARAQIAAAKALAPAAVLAVIDRAIQVHGGAGVSNDTPLATMWAAARTLRLADGPDVVHLETVAKVEMARAAARRARL